MQSGPCPDDPGRPVGTIALFDTPNGGVARYVVDPGDGIPFRWLGVTERSPEGWWEVRIWSGERGYLDPSRGWEATATADAERAAD